MAPVGRTSRPRSRTRAGPALPEIRPVGYYRIEPGLFVRKGLLGGGRGNRESPVAAASSSKA